MLNFIATLWGIVTLLFAFVCLFPFLGWGNWLVILFAIVVIIISAFSDKKNGMYLNVVTLL